MLKSRIFISAVTRECKTARQLVANTLTLLGNYEPVWQDIFGLEAGDLRDMLRRKVDSCSAVLQIVGKAYGAEPQHPDPSFGRISYTQFEAVYAEQCGKKVYYLFLENAFPRDETSEQI